jgi:hypothetical protein
VLVKQSSKNAERNRKMIEDELEALFFDYLQVEDVGSGTQACLIWLSKFQRLLANINALGQTGQLLGQSCKKWKGVNMC